MATAHSNAARQRKRKLVLYFTLLWTTRVLVSIKGFKGRVYPPLWAYKHLQRRRLWSVRRCFVQKYVTRFAQTPVLPNAVKDRKMETSISKSGETPPRVNNISCFERTPPPPKSSRSNYEYSARWRYQLCPRTRRNNCIRTSGFWLSHGRERLRQR